ncbi:MAG: ABC transporter permease [Phycisphaerae bacterium]|nr:ABC transporter permease [Phycisphaerae bacterium]
MSEQPSSAASSAAAEPGPAAVAPGAAGVGVLRPIGWLFRVRGEPTLWQSVLFGALCLGICLGVWWLVTRGEAESRTVGPAVLPSPGETFATFDTLWFDRALTRNTLASLRRVALGFGLATLIGVPLGVLCGCFSWCQAFFAPLSIFGRNIPVAALIPLTFSLFGIGEQQKIMFIFIACVAFIISDSAQAVRDVDMRYVDTAHTLGARRRQIIMKVLVPLALPDIFNSLRLLFGLAFGYIMLAELVKFGGESGGLGDIIITSQRRGPKEHILLVLMIIPVVALAIDRILYWAQRELFPHRYGGFGFLHAGVRFVVHLWEDLKGLFWRSHRRVELPVTSVSAPEKKP